MPIDSSADPISWIMLGREPRSASELLMVYAASSRMARRCPPGRPYARSGNWAPPAVRQVIRRTSDERRLAEAYRAVLSRMRRLRDLGSLGSGLLRLDESGDGQARVAGAV